MANRKTVMLTQHTATAALVVGLRQKATTAALSDRTAGQQGFSAAYFSDH
jgi:hypothetical protein